MPESGTVAQLWCIVEGLLHWCHCISLSQRAEEKSGQADPVAGCLLLPDECFCDLGARDGQKGSGKEETKKEILFFYSLFINLQLKSKLLRFRNDATYNLSAQFMH